MAQRQFILDGGFFTDDNSIIKAQLDMDNNKIINVALPVDSSDVANKSYVDSAISGLVDAAPAALDTLNELAAALGDDANFAGTVTTALAAKADITYADQAEADAIATAAADATAKADAAEATAISTAAADATTKANAAEVNATATAAIDATNKANAAQAAAVTTAASDATTKANAAESNANAYTDAAVSNVVNGAPGALDTLNELAAALGDDANFASNITNSIASKLDSASYTAADVLAKIKTVDGSGSGLDADLLDGVSSGSFLRSDQNDNMSGQLTMDNNIVMNGNGRQVRWNSPESGDVAMMGYAENWYLFEPEDTAGTQVPGGGRQWMKYTDDTGLDVLGNVTATGNVTAYSDERLKSDITTIEKPLEKVMNLRGCNYVKDGEYEMGVIAQEVEKVIPEVVVDGDEFKSVAYGNMVGLLIEAIKEQQAQIEELKSKLEG